MTRGGRKFLEMGRPEETFRNFVVAIAVRVMDGCVQANHSGVLPIVFRESNKESLGYRSVKNFIEKRQDSLSRLAAGGVLLMNKVRVGFRSVMTALFIF